MENTKKMPFQTICPSPIQGVSDATFVDLFLLRDCDALVGTFGSHFSKVAYELSGSLLRIKKRSCMCPCACERAHACI